MIEGGATLSEVVEYLCERLRPSLTPFNLIFTIREAVGLSVPDLWRILELFDAEFRPIESVQHIDQVGEELFADVRRP